MDYSKKGRDQMQVLTYCSKICHQTEILSKIVDAINKPDALELIEHAKILAVEREVDNSNIFFYLIGMQRIMLNKLNF